MTKGTDMREQDLDDLFAEARAQEPLESPGLMARVLADAERNIPPQIVRVVPRKPGLWAKFAMALGGNGVLAGLGTAAVAGVMLGFVQPTSLSAVTDMILAETPLDEVDLLPGIDAILTEG
jgi:hypothetical protein